MSDISPQTLTHLQRLEAEAIHIIREVVAEAEHPVMLYSVGKDSACMLHLARKAFYPSPPPFPLLHVDTTWKFRDMYAMRERMAREMGIDPASLPQSPAAPKDISQKLPSDVGQLLKSGSGMPGLGGTNRFPGLPGLGGGFVPKKK